MAEEQTAPAEQPVLAPAAAVEITPIPEQAPPAEQQAQEPAPEQPQRRLDARAILREGMRARSRGSVVQSQQKEEAAPPTAPAEPPAPAPAQEVAPAEQEAPKAEHAPPAPTAPEETQAKTAPVPTEPLKAPSEPPGLPPEFTTREFQTRFEQDPHLRRELLGIWRRPGLSETAKATAIMRRVGASDQRIAESRARQEHIRNLRESGDLEAWAAEQRTQEALQDDQRRWARGVTEILARSLQVDADDPDFLGAGYVEPGEPEELRVTRFAEWAIRNSPAGRAYAQQLIAEQDVTHSTALEQARTTHQAELDTLRTSHDEQIKALNREWEQKMEAAQAEALANGRGTQRTFPPRSQNGLPVESEPLPVPTTQKQMRDLISQGLRLRREASRAVPE